MSKTIFDTKKPDELIKSINWEPFFEKIKEMTKVDLALELTLISHGNDPYFKIRSQDISPLLGVGHLFQELRVINFGGSIDDEEGNFYIPINYSWKHFGGGSNGSSIVTAFYKHTTKAWTFRE